MTLTVVRSPDLLTGPVLPRCLAPEAQVECLCGGLLAYILGEWQHVDFCLECFDRPGEPCPERRHQACPDPEPVLCTHDADWRCHEPAGLLVRCAYARAERTCCGCCWLGPDD